MAWVWYRVLCVVLVLMQGLLVWGGVAIRQNASWFYEQDPKYSPEMYASAGMLLIVSGVVFGILNIAIIFLPRKPWVYALHTSNAIAAVLLCCPAPLAIWVLVMIWKPENRRWYGA